MPPKKEGTSHHRKLNANLSHTNTVNHTDFTIHFIIK
jgi:hypothetical protein